MEIEMKMKMKMESFCFFLVLVSRRFSYNIIINMKHIR